MLIFNTFKRYFWLDRTQVWVAIDVPRITLATRRCQAADASGARATTTSTSTSQAVVINERENASSASTTQRESAASDAKWDFLERRRDKAADVSVQFWIIILLFYCPTQGTPDLLLVPPRTPLILLLVTPRTPLILLLVTPRTPWFCYLSHPGHPWFCYLSHPGHPWFLICFLSFLILALA